MGKIVPLIGQLQWRDVKIPIIKGFDGEMLKIDQHNPLHSILRFNPAQKQKPTILRHIITKSEFVGFWDI